MSSRAIVCLLLAAVVAQAAPLAAKDKDDVVGTRWSYTLKHGQKTQEGTFRVFNLEVFKGPNKVGVVRPKDDDETTLIIDGYPELNGTAVLRKTERKPPVWAGTLKKDSGTAWQMRVHIKDR